MTDDKPSKAKAIGGKFKFKKKSSHSVLAKANSKSNPTPGLVSLEDVAKLKGGNGSTLTEVQRRHRDKMKTVEEREVKAVTSKSYRERIEEFNYKLSTTTEHNDIPRISAAGNG